MKHPVFLACASAFLTSLLGYLINQLPEIPNKAENYRWIIVTVAIVTAIVWLIGIKLNSDPNQEKTTIETENLQPESQKSVRQYNNYGRDQINIENIKGNSKIGGS